MMKKKSALNFELMRHSLEKKVYMANDRLTSDADRWQEVNHLLLEALRRTENSDKKFKNPTIYLNRFLENVGLSESDLKIDRKKVFVLTPFHQRFDNTFDLIFQVCNKVGLKCIRGDEEFINGPVLNHILKEMLSAAIIIANIDGRSPNVYYELGIAHALDKNVILVSSSLEEVPFDVKSHRLIIWESNEQLQSNLNLTLTRLLVEG